MDEQKVLLAVFLDCLQAGRFDRAMRLLTVIELRRKDRVELEQLLLELSACLAQVEMLRAKRFLWFPRVRELWARAKLTFLYVRLERFVERLLED
jgi:hypothetical protein